MDIFHPKIETRHGCMLWTGHKTVAGYARARVNNELTLLHRYFYEKQHGSIPEGYRLLNKCGKKHCIRPNCWKLTQNGHGAKKGKFVRYGAEIKQKALEMRESGMSYRKISAELGPGPDTISRWCD